MTFPDVATLESSPTSPEESFTSADYVEAGRRFNTERSYAAGVRHFEEVWGGLLPATAPRVADYLAHYAGTLTQNTLRARLAALARWHADHGFADPTRDSLVRATLKGIRAVHPAREHRALPLQIGDLTRVDETIAAGLLRAEEERDRPLALRLRRDRALLLLGFWKGFRGDELLRIRVEDVALEPDKGLRIHLPRSKSDRRALGASHAVPALSRLCPVAALRDWCTYADLRTGPVFRRVGPHGHLGEQALHINSLVGVIQRRFHAAQLAHAGYYTGHSLRRGFASWAAGNGWDARALMEYVGWKDIHSALRYIDSADQSHQIRLQRALLSSPA